MNARTPHDIILPVLQVDGDPVPLSVVIEQAQRLSDQGKVNEAIALYARWLEHPKSAGRQVALYNLASLLQLKGMHEQAEQCYLNCMSLAPAMGQAYVNLGLMLERLGRLEQALEIWSRFVARRHHDARLDREMLYTSLNHIGRVHENQKRYDLAESALRESLLVNPEQPGVIQHWVHIRQKSCIWPVYQALPGISVSTMMRYTSPLAMLALSDDPVQQQLCAQTFVQRTYSVKEERLHSMGARQPGRLRLGFVSGDFKEHAVGFLLPSFLNGVNPQQYELFGYDYAPQEQTALRTEILSKFHHVKRIADLDDAKAAELIALDNIDILIDLHGLSSGARPGIFARHPAPRQGTYLGYMGTTSMPWFDFVLVDRQVMSDELALHFQETPVYLEGCFIPLTGHRPLMDSSVNRQTLGLPEAAFVMAAFGNVYKITEALFDTWLDLLDRIPQSILWLLDDNDVTTQNLKHHAMERGIDLNRLVFARRCSHEEFCQRLKLADVYLDTYPYNCGSTTNDVVNAGIPFVTRYGRTLVSRMGKSILHHINHPHLATDSFEAYQDKVVEIWLDKRPHRQYPFVLDGGHDFSAAVRQIQSLPSLKGNERLTSTHDFANEKRRVMLQTHAHTAATGSGLHECAGIDMSYVQWVKSVLLSPSCPHLSLYGFLPAQAQAITGLDLTQMEAFSRHQDPDTDFIVLNPGWDLHGICASPIDILEHLFPGLSEAAEAFDQEMGMGNSIRDWIVPSEGFCLTMTLMARRRYWIYWLEWVQLWMDWGRYHPLLQKLTEPDSRTPSGFNLSDAIHAMIMNWVIKKKKPRISALNPLRLPSWQTPPLIAESEFQKINALKHAWVSTRDEGYQAAIRSMTGAN